MQAGGKIIKFVNDPMDVLCGMLKMSKEQRAIEASCVARMNRTKMSGAGRCVRFPPLVVPASDPLQAAPPRLNILR